VLGAAPGDTRIPLGQVAHLELERRAPGIKTEPAIPNVWVYVDVRDIDIETSVEEAKKAVASTVALPEGYRLSWSGKYEYLVRARQRLLILIPITLLIVSLIIYLDTRSLLKTEIVLLAVPFPRVGAFWAVYVAGDPLSVAVWVGASSPLRDWTRKREWSCSSPSTWPTTTQRSAVRSRRSGVSGTRSTTAP